MVHIIHSLLVVLLWSQSYCRATDYRWPRIQGYLRLSQTRQAHRASCRHAILYFSIFGGSIGVVDSRTKCLIWSALRTSFSRSSKTPSFLLHQTSLRPEHHDLIRISFLWCTHVRWRNLCVVLKTTKPLTDANWSWHARSADKWRMATHSAKSIWYDYCSS